MRQLSKLDHLLSELDNGLKTMSGVRSIAKRANPADKMPELELENGMRNTTIGLMRVNHAGEIAAQALYQGQSLFASTTALKENLLKAATEENDHLSWCAARIQELGGKTSYLDPFWYAGSFCIGVAASFCGDAISLGFLAETEQQVTQHLNKHLGLISEKDQKTRAILTQMRADEMEHADYAVSAGAKDLPQPLKKVMQFLAKIMTTTAFRI